MLSMQYFTIKNAEATLAVQGNYTTSILKAVKAEFKNVINNGCIKLIVDFNNTNIIDSTGLSQLCEFRNEVHAANFSARNAHGRVLTVLQDSNLDGWLKA